MHIICRLGFSGVTAILALAITGCATTPGQCDPSQADFFDNAGCLMSGSYAERQRALESELASERGRNASFRVLLADLETEQAQVKSRLRARQAKYARVDAAWRNLRGSLSKEMQTSAALRSRVQQIDAEVEQRKRVDASGDIEKKRAARESLQQKVIMLENELDAGVYE